MKTGDADQKRCRCGYDRSHPWIVPKPSYSIWGWILVGFGVSHPPVAVRFECDKCGEVFERITDRDSLRHHTYR